jgi:cell division septation protein DedD
MISQPVEQQDTEIILGTGKLLAIFFGLVAICGTFFGLGYSLGRSSSPMALQNGQPSKVAASVGTKPLAGVTVSTPANPPEATATPASDPNAAANSQVDQVPPADQASATDAGVVKSTSNQADERKTATPELASEAGNITVQVAAVTKQEDAEALVAALRRKNYPVFVSPNVTTDNLYHVQVGPFAELKDAETMKSKLAGDGYNAIVKK